MPVWKPLTRELFCDFNIWPAKLIRTFVEHNLLHFWDNSVQNTRRWLALIPILYFFLCQLMHTFNQVLMRTALCFTFTCIIASFLYLLNLEVLFNFFTQISVTASKLSGIVSYYPLIHIPNDVPNIFRFSFHPNIVHSTLQPLPLTELGMVAWQKKVS